MLATLIGAASAISPAAVLLAYISAGDSDSDKRHAATAGLRYAAMLATHSFSLIRVDARHIINIILRQLRSAIEAAIILRHFQFHAAITVFAGY
jgi:hypothetical protein